MNNQPSNGYTPSAIMAKTTQLLDHTTINFTHSSIVERRCAVTDNADTDPRFCNNNHATPRAITAAAEIAQTEEPHVLKKPQR